MASTAVIIVCLLITLDVTVGTNYLFVDDDLFVKFMRFHDCMSNMTHTTNTPDNCCQESKNCLDHLFGAVENYLSPEAEIRAKFEVRHELDHFRQDCQRIFDKANQNQLECQLKGINDCISMAINSDATTPICWKLMRLRDCLGPFEMNCYDTLFPDILKSVSFWIWKSNTCSHSNVPIATKKIVSLQPVHNTNSTMDGVIQNTSISHLQNLNPKVMQQKQLDQKQSGDSENVHEHLEMKSSSRNFLQEMMMDDAPRQQILPMAAQVLVSNRNGTESHNDINSLVTNNLTKTSQSNSKVIQSQTIAAPPPLDHFLSSKGKTNPPSTNFILFLSICSILISINFLATLLN